MSAADMFWAAPPISRTITAAAVLISFPSWLGFIDPSLFMLDLYSIFTFQQIPQIWRLLTTFILTGPKLGLILDPYFLYTYGSSLETTSPSLSQPGDFFTYLVFVSVIILILGGFFLSGPMLMSALTLALAYTYAQDNPNMQMNYFVITMSVKYLPVVMLAMTTIMASPGMALIQSSGLVAAHAWHFLTKIWPEYGGGQKYISTPQRVRQWFLRPGTTPTRRGAGTAFNVGASSGAQNVPQRQTGSSGGWTSGVAGNTNWGPGRRLGGE